MGMRTVLTGLAGMLLGSMMPVQADMPRPTGLAADIRWTAYGVPHIRAKDERGLGYGIGYAYARDNACLLAEEIVTARGERARYFGSEGKSSAELDNLPSDIFYAWLNQPEALQAFWQAQTPAVRQLLEGYAAGFNRFLREADGKTTSCLGQPWLRAIATDDLLRLTRRLLVEGGVGQFADALVAAAPPGTEKVALSGEQAFQVAEQRRQRFRLERGSNAIAVGSERSADGKGMLLANPHFPWNGAMRFYQMHLTIPGRLDVMGASLPGLPVVNIGFSRHLAWTHTVDTSSHFTLYRLALDPKDPRRYLVDGRSLPLEEKSVAIEVRGADGKLSRVEHKVYQSIYGPLVVWPGKLDWNRSEAYALRDANLENTRVLQQWYSINQASDVADLRRRVEALQGIPWVNTLAADEQGNALYMNQSVVPYLKPELIPACAIPQLVAEGLPALQGQDSRCAWSRDPAAAQAGITPAAQLPVLLRRDFVQNSNDSAWLTNPASPLQGFSPLVSQEKPIGPRARYALSRLQGKQPLEAKALEEMVTANHVFSADQVLPDLLRLCRDNQGEKSLARACAALAQWDRGANLDSGSGFVYFQRFMQRFAELDGAWKEPFDAQRPLDTPQGIALDRPQVAAQVRQALADAAAEVEKSGIPDGARWGDLQVSTRGQERIAIPGGDGHFGVYNAIQSVRKGDHLEVVGGTSYIQLVTFPEEGPKARGLLAFSQSSDPRSPHYRDQTELFSRQQWQTLPFSDRQIDADPQLQRISIHE
ncbi:acyl-homoserine lactone acylase PvdQ [Pseudomonas aeruginosa]|uniref:bifunctional acylase PvdQ n=2 Tax=Pseudomonas aeruginosa TaxID=287 RepID=UPI00044AAAFA|nr:acyl-homoserine lactone acylase PvdQ [Pseudomonas aeruginosa]EKU1962329.1 acyl-homoserine lactone acylase PvdQ [Pseudomonas aeruginosa]EKV3607008.1 acyl-homoserine lactone acylase PvdQ [Pseudomonas aeruginosa]EKW6795938.1 acyl-homoserine lactone acylase PvdQ [Pseudomonas aeruginosa]ELD6250176.1 acyl-homoserine lactone acylase PvdQ [Pseudomonas aeruginosa]ELK4863203.1 acyl-homoserine lactone acylase PvdQ [Pseudomonas aeruginosa]